MNSTYDCTEEFTCILRTGSVLSTERFRVSEDEYILKPKYVDLSKRRVFEFGKGHCSSIFFRFIQTAAHWKDVVSFKIVFSNKIADELNQF